MRWLIDWLIERGEGKRGQRVPLCRKWQKYIIISWKGSLCRKQSKQSKQRAKKKIKKFGSRCGLARPIRSSWNLGSSLLFNLWLHSLPLVFPTTTTAYLFPSLATPPIPKELKIPIYRPTKLVVRSHYYYRYYYYYTIIYFFCLSLSSSGSSRSFCNLPVCFSVDGWMDGWDVVPRSAAVGLVAVEKKPKGKNSHPVIIMLWISLSLPTVPYLPAQVWVRLSKFIHPVVGNKKKKTETSPRNQPSPT